jgi:cytochrome c oxidase subunit II
MERLAAVQIQLSGARMPNRSSPPLVALAALVAAISAGCLAPTDTLPRGRELYESCMPCHGEHGAGNPAILAPNIAGMPQWYVEQQVMKFRAGKRGYHFDDIAGLRMRPMALSMPTEDDVKTVAAYIAQMPRVSAGALVQGGDAAKGQQLFATCIACHGADGAGNQALNAPAIAGSDDWYLLEQLHKFKRKVRGDPAVDPIGATMQAMTATLVDDQAMKDVVAYIKTLPPPAPAPAAPAHAAPAAHGG